MLLLDRVRDAINGHAGRLNLFDPGKLFLFSGMVTIGSAANAEFVLFN